jgi:hypothetical protein
MPLRSGSRALASDVVAAAKKIVARGRRLSNSTTTTSEVGVLRLDDIEVLGDHIYEISTSSLLLGTSVANDIVLARLRYTTDGSTPSTSSTLLTQAGERIEVTANGAYTQVVGTYAPASDETLSVLLSVTRTSGSGSVGINYGSAVPIELYVIDLGEDPGDTGVDI